jgi:nucleoside-diphosphate-sugar epimerase
MSSLGEIMNILLTGATGFVGEPVTNQLADDKDFNVVAAVRENSNQLANNVKQILIGDLLCAPAWEKHLIGIDVVVHIAARAHIMSDTVLDPLLEFRKMNVEVTRNLAYQASQAGVKRFVFISSIKVNGEATAKGSCFTPDDTHITLDPYGISKREAELALRKIAQETGMDVVIVRPPLVYGPGVKANFRRLMISIKRGVPLPLGAVHNKRSFVALDNLVGFIILCAKHPKAANQTFLIADGEDVSTTNLLKKIAQAFGRKAILISIPVIAMKYVAKFMGKSDVADRLFCSLQVDISKSRELLGWESVITMDEQLKKACWVYNNEKNI